MLARLWADRCDLDHHLRGFPVARDFEGHVRGLTEPTRNRLRYYRRWLAPELAAGGEVALYGICRATDRDEDVLFYRALLQAHALAPGARAAGTMTAPLGATTAPLGVEELRARGWQLYTGGLSHKQLRSLGPDASAAAAAAPAASLSERAQ